MQKLTTAEFIEKARTVHGDRYGYDKASYAHSQTPVIITCKLHGDFSQRGANHLRGQGCPMCGRKALA